MLAAALPFAAELGMDRALITCDQDNVASRRTIERNGGVPLGRLDEKLRFWLPIPRRPDRAKKGNSEGAGYVAIPGTIGDLWMVIQRFSPAGLLCSLQCH